MDKYKLIKEILLLSESKVWDNAKLEWNLNFITFEKNRCICWKKRATLPNFALPKKGFFVGGIAPTSHKTNYHE